MEQGNVPERKEKINIFLDLLESKHGVFCPNCSFVWGSWVENITPCAIVQTRDFFFISSVKFH